MARTWPPWPTTKHPGEKPVEAVPEQVQLSEAQSRGRPHNEDLDLGDSGGVGFGSDGRVVSTAVARRPQAPWALGCCALARASRSSRSTWGPISRRGCGCFPRDPWRSRSSRAGSATKPEKQGEPGGPASSQADRDAHCRDGATGGMAARGADAGAGSRTRCSPARSAHREGNSASPARRSRWWELSSPAWPCLPTATLLLPTRGWTASLPGQDGDVHAVQVVDMGPGSGPRE